MLGPLDCALEHLELSGRGAWQAELDNGAAIELGRGSEEEAAAAAPAASCAPLTQVTHALPAPAIEYADLRHADGYALRLKGVGTTAPAGKPAAKPRHHN